MNISFIINNLSFGGAEKMATFVANSLSKRGHNISIFVLNNGEIHQEINKSINVFHYDKPLSKNVALQYINWINYFSKIARKERSEILVSFLGAPNLVCTLISRYLSIPSIISERGDPNVSFSERTFITRLTLWLYNHSNGAVFQTSEASCFFSNSLQKRSIIIPNPISIDNERQRMTYDNQPKTIVFLGRLDNKQKRLDILLQAFEEFYTSHREYQLIIYGRGPAQSYIENYVMNHNLSKCVVLKGVSHSSIDDISKEEIFVLSSDYEGISNSLLEAMAIGMPVVTTDHSPGGGRLLVQDHKNGILVPVRDPHSMCLAFSEFADNPALREQCGTEAKKVTIRFHPDKIIDKWEAYLKSYIKE